MRNEKKLFILAETVLAAGVIALAIMMIKEKSRGVREKVSVIIENSDDGQWSAFKYGLKMAAQDYNIELFIVPTSEILTVEEEQTLIENEVDRGADAIIVDPVLDEDVGEMLKKVKVPVMLIDDLAYNPEILQRFCVSCGDNNAMGADLGAELLEDYNGNLSGKTVGIYLDDLKSNSASERMRSFESAVKQAGGTVVWVSEHSSEEQENLLLEDLPKADIVVALDDASLTAAGQSAALNNLHGARVYGIGNSTQALYYLDSGIVDCVVVPDDFRMGYESLAEVIRGKGIFREDMKDIVVSHTVIRRETLFLQENQEIIFTMSQ